MPQSPIHFTNNRQSMHAFIAGLRFRCLPPFCMHEDQTLHSTPLCMQKRNSHRNLPSVGKSISVLRIDTGYESWPKNSCFPLTKMMFEHKLLPLFPAPCQHGTLSLLPLCFATNGTHEALSAFLAGSITQANEIWSFDVNRSDHLGVVTRYSLLLAYWHGGVKIGNHCVRRYHIFSVNKFCCRECSTQKTNTTKRLVFHKFAAWMYNSSRTSHGLMATQSPLPQLWLKKLILQKYQIYITEPS